MEVRTALYVMDVCLLNTGSVQFDMLRDMHSIALERTVCDRMVCRWKVAAWPDARQKHADYPASSTHASDAQRRRSSKKETLVDRFDMSLRHDQNEPITVSGRAHLV